MCVCVCLKKRSAAGQVCVCAFNESPSTSHKHPTKRFPAHQRGETKTRPLAKTPPCKTPPCKTPRLPSLFWLTARGRLVAPTLFSLNWPLHMVHIGGGEQISDAAGVNGGLSAGSCCCKMTSRRVVHHRLHSLLHNFPPRSFVDATRCFEGVERRTQQKKYIYIYQDDL